MGPAESIVACGTCGQLQVLGKLRPGTAFECCRCRALIARRRRGGVAVSAALTLAALILYIPANIFPVLRMDWYGAYSENTVWEGVVNLAKSNQWLVAGIVFLASIVIPLVKLLGLFFLTSTASLRETRWLRVRTAMFRVIDVVGPWAMLDVFLVAILVALVKLGQLATILPGRGLLAFAGVVVLTLLASATFDPQLIWEDAEGCNDR